MSLIRSAVVMLGLMTIVTGGVYPLAMTAVAQLVFSEKANGSLVLRDGTIVGSVLIGQEFRRPKYFWGRLSATSPSPYQAAASAGSNLGPLSPELQLAVKERLEALYAADPDASGPVPVDLVTASGSGLDPRISPAAAYYQAGRVARVRGMDVAQVRALIGRRIEGRVLGFLGEPRVNVLLLNLALDRAAAQSQ